MLRYSWISEHTTCGWIYSDRFSGERYNTRSDIPTLSFIDKFLSAWSLAFKSMFYLVRLCRPRISEIDHGAAHPLFRPEELACHGNVNCSLLPSGTRKNKKTDASGKGTLSYPSMGGIHLYPTLSRGSKYIIHDIKQKLNARRCAIRKTPSKSVCREK